MRTFLALTLDHDSRMMLADWRQRRFPGIGRPVPAQNLHVTLLFLGEVTQHTLRNLIGQVDQVIAPAFELNMDQLEYLPKTGMLWLTSSQTPDALAGLVKSLRRIARKHQVKLDRKPFRPHITLLRKSSHRLDTTIIPPAITLHCHTFTLFQSVFTNGGVRYLPVQEWDLD